VWGIVPGKTYPYLLSFSAPTEAANAITGVVHVGLTGGVLAGVEVVAVLNGTTVLGLAVTNASGFYSIAVPAGTLTAGSTVVTYLPGPPSRPTRWPIISSAAIP